MDRIRNVVRKHQVENNFNSICKISQFVKRVQNIPFFCGIGESISERRMSTFVSQTTNVACKSSVLTHSGVADHEHNTEHQLLFVSTTVVTKFPFYFAGKIHGISLSNQMPLFQGPMIDRVLNHNKVTTFSSLTSI